MARIIEMDGDTLILTAREAGILKEFLKDGASTKVLADRTGYTAGSCNNVLTNIAFALDMSRMEMVVALFRDRVKIRVEELWGKRRDLRDRELAVRNLSLVA